MIPRAYTQTFDNSLRILIFIASHEMSGGVFSVNFFEVGGGGIVRDEKGCIFVMIQFIPCFTRLGYPASPESRQSSLKPDRLFSFSSDFYQIAVLIELVHYIRYGFL